MEEIIRGPRRGTRCDRLGDDHPRRACSHPGASAFVRHPIYDAGIWEGSDALSGLCHRNWARAKARHTSDWTTRQ